jgi:hypothetical protein
MTSHSAPARRLVPALLVACAGLALAANTPAALAQPGEPAPKPAPKGEAAKPVEAMDPTRVTVLSLELNAIDRVLVDPKDAGLLRALKLGSQRLSEIPREVGVPPQAAPPRTAWQLVDQLWGQGIRLALQYAPSDQNPMGAAALLSFTQPDDAGAAKTHALVNGFVDNAPFANDIADSTTQKGSREFESPVGAVRWGPRQLPSDSVYQLSLGEITNEDKAFGYPEIKSISPGVKNAVPFVKFRFDLAPLTPLADLIVGFAGGDPRAEDMVKEFTSSGLIGPQAVSFDTVFGHTADRTIGITRAVGQKKFIERSMVSAKPLSPAQLRAIPADAWFGGIAAGDLTYFRASMDKQFADNPELADFYKQGVEFLGFDPIKDVLGQFSGHFAYYASDATGGGGFSSFVILAGINDDASGAKTSEKLLAKLDSLLREAAKKSPAPRGQRHWSTFVQATTFQDEGITYSTLTFPGFPVPVEPTYAIAGNWLILGFSPQATKAAALQALGKGDAGIMSHPDVAEVIPAGTELVFVQFNDIKKTLRAGYPLVQAGGAALTNALRSAPGATPKRDPGLIVPTYAQLSKGARSTIAFSRWVGDDMITEWHADRSLLVNAAGFLGALRTFEPLLLPLSGAAVAAFAQARDSIGGMRQGFGGQDEPQDGPEGGRRPGRQRPNFMIVPADHAAPLPEAWPDTTAPCPAAGSR